MLEKSGIETFKSCDVMMDKISLGTVWLHKIEISFCVSNLIRLPNA